MQPEKKGQHLASYIVVKNRTKRERDAPFLVDLVNLAAWRSLMHYHLGLLVTGC